MRNSYIIPIFVPCNNSISDYFFNKNIYNNKKATKDDVKKQLDKFLKAMKNEDDSDKEVVFIDGNLLYADKDIQEEILEEVYSYKRSGDIDSIRISAMPDCINKDNLKLLKKYGVKTIELLVNSSSNYILKHAGFNYTFEDVKKVIKLIKRYRFNIGYQMLVGLPHSTKFDDYNTAKDLIKLKAKIVRVSLVYVYKDSKLESKYEKGDYEPLSVSLAIERCKEIIYMFNRKKIDVLGMQDISLIYNKKEDIIAGPYDKNFRELVENSIWYDSIVEKIKQINAKVKKVKIMVNPDDIENVSGINKANIKKINDLYNVEIDIESDDNIKKGKSQIEILSLYED